MALHKQKFATQVDPELLEQTREIAREEGRLLQSVVEEALIDLIEKKRSTQPRAHVMAHYEAGVVQFDALYKRLAK